MAVYKEMFYKDQFHHKACIVQLEQSLGYWFDDLMTVELH
jgi:hypothetical protein